MEKKKIKGEFKITSFKTTKDLPSLRKSLKKALSKPLTHILEILFGGAISLRASDIHFEPEEEKLKIRLRIDGILQNLISLPLSFHQKIVSRIKILSRMKLNITRRPQDGRFSLLLNDKEIEVRVSSLPSQYGESIVLRILNPEMLIDIDNLGMEKEILEIVKKELKKPYGMIIVTGPTGSGKTTTLYAFLKEILRPEIKIITIEDPIEYKIEGISQTQVNPSKGYDFASGLKSIMRQDPDVILVGEIRDFETAKIALQAALTGHLVLTTLHTNDSAGTIARLQALGEKPQNIAPALNFVIAQRLIRKVCQKCKTKRKITPSEYKILKKELKNIKKIKISPSLTIFDSKGCSFCNFTGYRQRTGIFEFFLVDEEIKEAILKNLSIEALRKKLKEKGMITMYQAGLLKIIKGITTFEELERVLGKK